MERTKCSKIGFLSGVTLLSALAGCAGHMDGPRLASGYAPPPPDYVESEVVTLQDEYVYYPDYEVYYLSNRRQYVYLQDGSWVSRPVPPRVPAGALFASRSVRLDFHDSPSIHHASVVHEHPKHWLPPGASHGKKFGHDQGNKKDKQGRESH